ncbi:site-specific integrase [Heliorestis acidaminivorans]|uniref:Site-specific integrase n=1 Tax=Heliorestis acidaminivorans TaxID=553427 RepID=A0A6I0F2P2_9FIRM|nr:site-specific integrase [Heliorestis acidaminivorans]KAB2954251.1 site-specific integrase [Heliorestis acidaminivorans]
MAKGSIKKVEGKRSTSWRVIIDLPKGPEGKRRQKSLTYPGMMKKREVEKKLREMLQEIDGGTWIEPQKTTLAEFLESWLQEHEDTVSVATARKYRNVIDCHIVPAIGDIPLQKLGPLDVQRLIEQLKTRGNKKEKGGELSPTTIKYVIRFLRFALKRAVETGLIKKNPTEGAKIPRQERKEIDILSENEIGRLFDLLKGSYIYGPAKVAFHTGARLTEVLGLTWDCVDLEGAKIRIEKAYRYFNDDGEPLFTTPKTKAARRTIGIDPELVAFLKEHRIEQEKARRWSTGGAWASSHDLVFTMGDGSPIIPGALSSLFSQKMKKAGIATTFHGLRHSHVSILIKAGVPITTISGRVGHANPSITHSVYAHLLEGMDDQAVNAFAALMSQAKSKRA